MNLSTQLNSFLSDRPLNRLIAVLGLLTAYCVALLAARISVSDELTYVFLAWNLFLAWIPLGFAVLAPRLFKATGSWLATLSSLGAWLLFLPNAPYILTDLIHLRPRVGIPYWFDILLLLSFAFAGLLLGFASLQLVHRFLNEKLRPVYSWLLVGMAVLASSFGIYLGRVLRWNSWDILQEPGRLMYDVTKPILHPFVYKETVLMTLGFAGFMFLGYLVFSVMLAPESDFEHEK